MIDIINSQILKKRFIKDSDIPISLFKEPYFMNRINLLDNLFNSKYKWEEFIQEVSLFESEQQYLEYYNQVKDEIINYIKSKPEYQDFNCYDFNNYKVNNYGIGDHGVFAPKNNNKRLLSFDLKKANFQAFKKFNSNLMDNYNSYEEFISKFTKLDHIINSKYIRQVIFGNCNPKRQVTIEKFLMSGVLDIIVNAVGKDIILTYMHDEIVVDITSLDKSIILEIISNVEEYGNSNNIKIKNEEYLVYQIPNTEFYVQYFDDESYKFKCVPALFYPIIVKQFKGLFVDDEDLIYYHEGYLSKFIEIPKFTFRNDEVISNEL
jgi:hypothetical protein